MMSARSTGALLLILFFMIQANIVGLLFIREACALQVDPSAANALANEDAYQDDDDEYEDDEFDDQDDQPQLVHSDIDLRAQFDGLPIKILRVEGNVIAPESAILSKVPFKNGQVFDSRKSAAIIKNVSDLGYFKNVELYGKLLASNEIELVVLVEEKIRLLEVEFNGNRHLSEREIFKKLDFSKITTVDEADLPRYIGILKKLYRDKDYHNVQITAQIEQKNDGARIVFAIRENHKSLVKRVIFKGNEYYTGKKLRSLIFTHEDWVAGFLDHAGSYQPEMVEADKQVIENYYQSNGFLNARVIDAQIQSDTTGQDLTVTYQIQEGDQYCISEIEVPGNDLISGEYLCERLPIKVGDLYSKDKIRDTMEGLRLLWGDFGYIYADIQPNIVPDDSTKTVKLGFYTELGPQVYLDSITIRGNEKTLDKVIRRQLLLQEGGLLTTKGMEDSKNRVELLGYFDQRGGVNWKINRLGNDKAALELFVREVKTGRAEINMGFGGSQRDASSPMESLSVRGALSDTNLFGRGIHFSLSGEYAKREINFLMNVTQPWLFDRPISAGFDLFTKKTSYDEFYYMENNRSIHEQIVGGALNLGFIFRRANDSQWVTRVIVEDVRYTHTAVDLQTSLLTFEEKTEYQQVINNRFHSGIYTAWALNVNKDTRNHPLHPNRGYQWQAFSKVAFPNSGYGFGFFKTDLDASWYTPLINERSLIFALHGHLGLIAPFKNRAVPFRELYNMGGPATVRGFEFGEIGPQWVAPRFPARQSPLGATKAFWMNAELIFPISADFSMKGCVFYDGGAGWDTVDSSQISELRLRNNHFSYRHAVGIGIRVLRPTPIRIDWGFKLDRRKGEEATRVHFTAYQEF